ncbi:MAG: YdcF family protein [Leptolyngbyaceae cyanobacterium SL_1_1]|nr:YdcF family protein [Leptolyngbyaceae cyanobacterium RM1_1_2]NJO08383.1 YdcF family protein [Leptolyngbyaceae cyanobacterium SL_1_1]
MRSHCRQRPRISLRLWQIACLGGLLWLAQRQLKSQFIQPQVALVLGGAAEREFFAARFAQTHPEVQVWVSSGSNPEYAEWVFAEAKIEPGRVRLDYEAVDTVTNFTSLVDDLAAANIKSIYLITSDYHMRRAEIIGQIVLGSRGIRFRPIAVPTQEQPETLTHGLRDGARAILWVFTGQTGSDWGQFFSHYKLP